MINASIKFGTYVESQDTTMSDLELFQDFLQWIFINYKKYDKKRPVANQPVKLFATGKTHKFKNK